MSFSEKRHINYRVGSMLHHRFPNGFTDLSMDETDREVSTLTDRAFRSLCVGDEAVYNDDFLYGYSPFSCHKPLVGEPSKKTHLKESKKHVQHKNHKYDNQLWKQQQKKNISQMSSFFHSLNATEENCDGLLIPNGGCEDSNGESWDKSALRSIQRELSEFSSDYGGLSNKTFKDAGLPTGKTTKVKNGKTTVKLKKLNIKNFFLHSEFSPFQTWTGLTRFPFCQEDPDNPILSMDNSAKWYDMSFYKELTEAHRKATVDEEEAQSCHRETVEPPPLPAPKPIPPPPPPKVMPKPSLNIAEKRCTSEEGEGNAAPWRRNRSRAKSAVPANHSGMQLQDNNAKTMMENLGFIEKEGKSVAVKAVDEVSSVASTPFSICQLMTPLIPSRQPTETSEILQGVLSPLALDLSLRPQSEAKGTPEPPIKRDSYKALASSILFNLKDNRKRVKSRYSPPKFKTLELPESATQSPQSDVFKPVQAGSDGAISGLSTPAIWKDELLVCSPIVEPVEFQSNYVRKCDHDRPISDDYLMSSLITTKTEASGNSDLGEENPNSPYLHSKKIKNHMAKKQNYPSLNLYKKSTPGDNDNKYLQVPLTSITTEKSDVSSPSIKKEHFPNALPTNTVFLPNVIKDPSLLVTPHASLEQKQTFNVSEKPYWHSKDGKVMASEVPPNSREKDVSRETMSTKDVIRAAREAINAAKNKALLATTTSNSISKLVSDAEKLRQKMFEDKISKEMLGEKRESETQESNNNLNQSQREATVKKEPPPVPKRTLAKSNIHFALEKQQMCVERVSNGACEETETNASANEIKSVKKPIKHKHIFSAKQNNYIKNQRSAMTDDRNECEEGQLNVNMQVDRGEMTLPAKETSDGKHIFNDLQALKELQKAKLGERMLENATAKLTIFNIEEEAKAKNDLISRELRNIKRGMLSMRGNTSAKRDIFVNKEKEQSKPEVVVKVDSNIRVNKALLNGNYDKAKMALEEIISEREKRKQQPTEQDTNMQSFGETVSEESSTTVGQQVQTPKYSHVEPEEEQTSNSLGFKKTDLRERLADLRDHNHLRIILSQTEPGLDETHILGRRVVQSDMDRTETDQSPQPESSYLDPSCVIENYKENVKLEMCRVNEKSRENEPNENKCQTFDVPPIPPRSKRGGSRSDESITTENEKTAVNVWSRNEELDIIDANPNEMEPSVEILKESEKEAVPNGSFAEQMTANSEVDVKSNQRDQNILFSLSPDITAKEKSISPTSEGTFENRNMEEQESSTRTQHLSLLLQYSTQPDEHLVPTAEEESIMKSVNQLEMRKNEDLSLVETHKNIFSPLLLVNGVTMSQSPPDQASLSSKSSYFSVESAHYKSPEAEPNIYHSLENLIGEIMVDQPSIPQTAKPNFYGTEVDKHYLGNHECGPRILKPPIKSPQKEPEESQNDVKEIETNTHDDAILTTKSLSNTFSPTLGIPYLFKVKDNTFTNKLKKTIQPWSPRASVSGVESVEEELQQIQPNPALPYKDETLGSTSNLPLTDNTEESHLLSIPFLHPSEPLLRSPLTEQNKISKKPQPRNFLTIPQEDRFSGLSPSSEGTESQTTSTADELEMSTGSRAEVTKVLSDSQTGLPKPPAVLPKSDKAVQKAIKIANRRMKKEETQNSSQNSSQSSSKSKSQRQKSEKSESRGSSKTARSGEKKQREKIEADNPQDRSNYRNDSNQSEQQGSNNKDQHETMRQIVPKTGRQNHNLSESHREKGQHENQSARQGRSSNRHIRDKPEARHCINDRVISNLPVYKAHVGESPMADRSFHRTQSIDRFIGGQVERRRSADMRVNERLESKNLPADKTIMDEFQQRGRAREKPSRDNHLRRSHSIDAYSTEVPHVPHVLSLSRQSSHSSQLSRQSSHTSQLSRQSSIEHAIIAQPIPLTQRKLLQDPESGQYFFVDMPVQVRTKTFFDPETGSYVQLPVQPPEGAVPQVSPMEVMPSPVVVYHSFVPVPLSPMAQTAAISVSHVEPNEFDRRNLERSRLMHYKEGHRYLEPVYGQHDNMLGEFKGTEELDCPS